MLDDAVVGIKKHTDVLKTLIEKNGGKESKEHYRGMEGLVRAAEKHALDEEIADDDVMDVIVLAQYQRMCHYGLAGIGTAAAYGDAVGLDEDHEALERAGLPREAKTRGVIPKPRCLQRADKPEEREPQWERPSRHERRSAFKMIKRERTIFHMRHNIRGLVLDATRTPIGR